VSAAAASLTEVGVLIDQARPAGIEQTFDLIGRLFGADGGAGVNMLLHMAGTTEPSPLLLRLGAAVQQFASSSAAEFGGVLAQWDMFRATMFSFFDRYDAILCPVNPFPAPLHGTTFDEDHLAGFSYTMAYNLTGWPSVVVRAGTSPEGLPIGVQVVARPWREDVALALAKQVEAVSGGWQPPTL
jgi:amidase